MAMTLGEIIVNVRSDTSHLVKGFNKAESSVSKATRNMNNAIKTLTAGFIGLSVIDLAKSLGRQADEMVNVNSKLKLVTKSTEELVNAQKELFKIAQQTRTSFTGTVDLYTNLAQSLNEMNKSQEDVLRTTETVNKAIAISGGSVQQAASAVQQLGQAFASGKLAGDELKSILENSKGLAKAIADGMGVPIGALKELGAEGKITSEVLFNALSKSADVVDEKFLKFALTIGGASTQLQNSTTKIIGQFDDVSGASSFVAKSISDISKSMDDLDPQKIQDFANDFLATVDDIRITMSFLNEEIEKTGNMFDEVTNPLTEFNIELLNIQNSAVGVVAFFATVNAALENTELLFLNAGIGVASLINWFSLSSEEYQKYTIEAQKEVDINRARIKTLAEIGTVGLDAGLKLRKAFFEADEVRKKSIDTINDKETKQIETQKKILDIKTKISEADKKAADELAKTLEKLNDQMVGLNNQLVASIGTEYEQWLNGVNNQMISLAKNGASAAQMMAVFNSEASKQVTANQTAVFEQTLKSTGTAEEKFLFELGNTISELGTKGATEAQQQEIYNAELAKFNTTQKKLVDKADKQAKALSENTAALNSRSKQESSSTQVQQTDIDTRKANIRAQIEAIRKQSYQGRGTPSGYQPIAPEAFIGGGSPYTTKTELLTRELRKLTTVTLKMADSGKTQEEAAIASKLAAEATESANEAMQRTLELFNSAFGDVISELGNISSILGADISGRASSVLFGSSTPNITYSEAYAGTITAMEDLVADLGNEDLATAYQTSIDTLINSLDELNDTSKFLSAADQSFAKATALNQIKAIEDSAASQLITVDENIQLLRDIRAAVNGDQPDSAINAVKDAVYVTLANDNLNAMTNDQILETVASNIVDTDETLGGTGLTDSVKGLLASVNGKVGLIKSSTQTYDYQFLAMGEPPQIVNSTQTYEYYKKGGFTDNGDSNKEVGIVHAGEWVAPKWMIESNPSLFNALEMSRTNGKSFNGFNDGGAVNNQTFGMIASTNFPELSSNNISYQDDNSVSIFNELVAIRNELNMFRIRNSNQLKDIDSNTQESRFA